MKKYLGVVAVGLALFDLVSSMHGQAAASVLPESDPLVKTWVPPVYPAELKAAKIAGNVTVTFVVDEKGVVSSVRAEKSSDSRFEAAAVASVAQWTFEPAVSEGVHVAMGVGVRLNFNPRTVVHGSVPPEESIVYGLPKSDAKSENPPRPEHPPDLLTRKIGGKAVVSFVVNPDGSIANLELAGTSHPGFVRPVLAAAQSLKFTPAMQGDLAVSARIVSPMEFDPEVAVIGEATTPQLELNGFSLRLTGEQTQRDLCSRPPKIWSILDPIYPRAAALGGIAGEAVADFDVDERGNVENIQLVSATAPEFGQALIDTLSFGGTFKPAMKDGRTVAVPMRWTYAFKQPAAEAVEGERPEERLIRALRAGQAIEGPKGLDGKLRPLWQVAPDYPKALRGENPTGTATVELIIDHDGRVRLPFVVNATHEAFGRAALIAASQWAFDAPTRGGQPTDARVRVPFQFTP